MPISDAQFTAWMNTDVERVLLAEVKFGYEGGSPLGPVVGSLYFANTIYAAEPTGSRPNQPYFDRIVGTPGFSRDLDINTLGGRATFSVSDLTLDNLDGELDYMLDLVIDGYPVNYFLGSRDWSRDDFRLVQVAVAERVSSTESSISVKLRDNRLLLDREIKGDSLGSPPGSPSTGGPNSAKFLPLLWGFAENIDLTQYLYDTVALTYGVISNYGAGTSGVAALRDDGVSLRSAAQTWASWNTSANAGTDVITHVAHGLTINDVIWFTNNTDPHYSQLSLLKPFAHAGAAAQYWVNSTPSADTLTLSLTRGGSTLDLTAASWNPDNGGIDMTMIRQRWHDTTATDGRIQLSSKAVGRLTADVMSFQDISGPAGPWGVDIAAPFNLAGGLMYGYGNTGVLDGTPFTAADTALDAKVATGFTSLWLPERKNLIAVLEEWLDSVFGWYGQDHLGALTVGLLDPSGIAAATATRTLNEADVTGEVSCENLPVTISRANLNYQLNRTVQADGLSRLLTESERMKYSSPFGSTLPSTAPSGALYSTNKPLYHKTMTEGQPTAASINTSIPGLSPAFAPIADYADEIVADRRPNLQVVRLSTSLEKYAWGLGDVVLFTHPRFGFDAGRNLRIVGISVDFLGNKVDLALLTYTAPDVTTTSHN